MSQLSEEHFATNVYYDRTFDCDAAKILPGEYYCTGRDMLIVTVLGSCVSACIRDRICESRSDEQTRGVRVELSPPAGGVTGPVR